MDIFTASEIAYKNGFKKGQEYVVPVAIWEFEESDGYGNKKPFCSNCKTYRLFSWGDWVKCKYCPECGAKIIIDCRGS